LIPLAYGAQCFAEINALMDEGARHDPNAHKSTNIYYGLVDFGSMSSDTNLTIVNNKSAKSDPIDYLLKAYKELNIPLNAMSPLSIIDEVD